MDLAERDQNLLRIEDAPSCGLHLGELIFQTILIYLLLGFFLTELPRAASWMLTAECSCRVAEALTVCAKRAPLCNSLLEASHLQMVTEFYLSNHPRSCPSHYSFPIFRVPVQRFGNLLSLGRVNVTMLWSVVLMVHLRGLSLQWLPELHPGLRAFLAFVQAACSKKELLK